MRKKTKTDPSEDAATEVVEEKNFRSRRRKLFFFDEVEEEKNLNAVLLLEPINEEGAIMLIELKLKNSDFSKVKTLLNDFEKICKKLCYKTKEITKKLKIASAAKKN